MMQQYLANCWVYRELLHLVRGAMIACGTVVYGPNQLIVYSTAVVAAGFQITEPSEARLSG